MSVVFMQAGNPAPGKQIDALEFIEARTAATDAAYGTKTTVYTRLGGPTGQIVTDAPVRGAGDSPDRLALSAGAIRRAMQRAAAGSR